MEFEAPQGTNGEARLPELGCVGKVLFENQGGNFEDVLIEVQPADAGPVTLSEVPGGRWTAKYECCST